MRRGGGIPIVSNGTVGLQVGISFNDRPQRHLTFGHMTTVKKSKRQKQIKTLKKCDHRYPKRKYL